MKIIWLGHSGFRIEIEDQVLLIDPWLTGNPMFPDSRASEATDGATAILITHGHGDHASNALSIAKNTGAPVVCIHELATRWGDDDGVDCIGFGKGGTITVGSVSVSMVNASHSASIDFEGQAQVAGSEAGFMISGEGHTIYVTGDTDIMADMAWFGEYYAPDIGILCAGGHYTMDMKAAAWAAQKYFNFKVVIPCHFKTFPILAQSADDLKAGLRGVDVREPSVLESIEL
jgi:L-ascorbate metabolism protein UlaG (beta-lactamase superfamily)